MLSRGLDKMGVSRILRYIQKDTKPRKETRIPKDTPIYYKFPKRAYPWKQARAINVSESGLCIIVNRPIGIGEELEIEIAAKLPESKEISKVVGHVVWVESSPNGFFQYQYGIALKDKSITFQRERKIIWETMDTHCLGLVKSANDAIGHAVQDLEQLKAGFCLVYQEYITRRICEPNSSRMHYTFYSLLPQTKTFLLRKNSAILGTVSLVQDSPCGLPIESVFPEEINTLRNEGRKLAEVSLLSLNTRMSQKSRYLFQDLQKQTYLFKLFKIMYDFARISPDITDLVIGVHPLHQDLYKYFHFETIGPERSYHGARGKPAVLMVQNVEATERGLSLFTDGASQFFLKNMTPLDLIQENTVWSSDSVNEFLFDFKPLWDSLSSKQKEHLKNCYSINGVEPVDRLRSINNLSVCN